MTDKNCPHVFFPMKPDWQRKCERIYFATQKMLKDCNGKAPTSVELVDFYAATLDANRQLGEVLPAYAAQLAIEAAFKD